MKTRPSDRLETDQPTERRVLYIFARDRPATARNRLNPRQECPDGSGRSTSATAPALIKSFSLLSLSLSRSLETVRDGRETVLGIFLRLSTGGVHEHAH
jgi:hypothetical protein